MVSVTIMHKINRKNFAVPHTLIHWLIQTPPPLLLSSSTHPPPPPVLLFLCLCLCLTVSITLSNWLSVSVSVCLPAPPPPPPPPPPLLSLSLSGAEEIDCAHIITDWWADMSTQVHYRIQFATLESGGTAWAIRQRASEHWTVSFLLEVEWCTKPVTTGPAKFSYWCFTPTRLVWLPHVQAKRNLKWINR